MFAGVRCWVTGAVFGVINLLRTMLAMPASVQEGLGVNAAVLRSRVLVAGRKGRIFLLLLLVYVLQIVAGSIQLPLVFIAMRAHGAQQVLLETIELLITFAATTVVGPVLSIALCLFYIDERVRREGYDIELLMQRSFAGRLSNAAQRRSLWHECLFQRCALHHASAADGSRQCCRAGTRADAAACRSAPAEDGFHGRVSRASGCTSRRCAGVRTQ